MGIITKGMGIIRKELFKKSKKYPGPGSEKQLGKKIETITEIINGVKRQEIRITDI